ncbi:MFS transporter [Pseudonocardia acaciae]|uniref:MFS transporter n=1 Tax=Pseudonocardia acaciae TaxID=551276 RepID=UPI0006879729|nr:MFS transporter [Pseudonocardia acaciae]
MTRSDRAGAVLWLACCGQFLVVLDVSVVNVALPSMRAALGVSEGDLQWVVNAYALAFGGFLLLGGRLADAYGRRWAFVLGLALFGAASLAGGLAGTAGTLIAARGAQGLGAAILAPATLTVLTASFPEGARRTRALAVWTAVSVAGGAAGNLVGGVLTDYLSWRAILLVNVPVVAVCGVLAVRVLDATAAAGGPGRRPGIRIDLPGAALVTGGLVLLSFGVARARDLGWGAAVPVAAMAAAVLALAGFVLVEARWAAAPLMPPRLFRRRPIWLGNVLMLLAGGCYQAPMWYFLTLYMQDVLGYSAVQAGLGFLPHTLLTVAVGLWLTPRLMARVQHRALITVGALLAAAGFWLQSRITPDDGYLSGILGPAVLVSVGGGLFNTPLTTAVTSGVDPADGGAAAGMMNTAKQVGGALGLSLLITLVAGTGRAFVIMAAAMVLVAALATALPGRRDRRRRAPGCPAVRARSRTP